jgi:general stress protein CsbA
VSVRTIRRRSLVWGVIVPVAQLVVALAVMLWALPDLPNPVAVHWGPSGEPDGFGTPALSLVLLPVVGLGYLILPTIVLRRMSESGPTTNQRLLLAIGPFFIGFLGTLIAGSLVMQRGLDDAVDGPSILPVLGVAFLIGVAGAIAAWMFLPPAPEVAEPSDAADLPARRLTTDERVVWVGRVAPRSRVLGFGLVVGWILVVGAAVLLAVVQPISLLILILPAALIVVGYACSYWTITVDRHGVLARGGFGSWPVIRIPLAEIRSARVTTVDPIADFGGWGLRWAPKSVGLIVRRGEALEVARLDGRTLVATLPGAAVPAELINALALRSRDDVR